MKCFAESDGASMSRPSTYLSSFRRWFAPLACGLGLTACASLGSFNSANTVKLLSDAGFKEKVPETSSQKEVYASTEAYRVKRVESAGKTFYVYKDEKSGRAYIGSEKDYQAYRRLAERQKINREQYEATQMQRQSADGWYGTYSPYNPYRNVGYTRY